MFNLDSAFLKAMSLYGKAFGEAWGCCLVLLSTIGWLAMVGGERQKKWRGSERRGEERRRGEDRRGTDAHTYYSA